MKQAIKAFIKRLPFIRDLIQQVKNQGAFPAGHYYSPIPSKEEVLHYVQTRGTPKNELPGINLNEDEQLELLKEYISFYPDISFPEEQKSTHRYYYNNQWFSYSDAIFLHCFLRRYTPKRIIEVGCGFSSALILDTIEKFSFYKPEVTFIEPYPDRLLSLLREGDIERFRLIEKKVQSVQPDVFRALESGDLLFIDSSHVVKCGSDLQFLIFEVLPYLKPGVFVHFHDIAYPFEYPSEWLLEGRYWNENYFLRAFLSYNSEWSIHFFTTYVYFRFGDLIREKMPLCTKNPGGSLYIQREQRA
ncbi:class I SAM-dependent methyltransferase [Chloracidobacterium aggregatum]|uniref:Class I SAM-dependent methyltransferase n=1 Tax=Chloracidobacterium sp. N TaxID=2821540 RepID=A0ABX8B2X0_9BACT|nr:class I SAM-dependent methyltransferase [Chloracidobacterium aggregatum]QUV83706.1 class I SAM-dependent methyltransferase [Chloracidobacterium sp. 2]QUV87812.1 class I SAM-dependent methyltransferase [Chloracidobacterium sp. S]QUV90711.1 class I SAM-dependent methyltransferase [Chloracidobacterium sp. A]QUV93926.1 class I SAM-dependent methyltransferase [Chloracidobacterium sp. N]QUV97116.1 class I SAM-dependent methyltransferase [Chloracidobacterium sp. E]